MPCITLEVCTAKQTTYLDPSTHDLLGQVSDQSSKMDPLFQIQALLEDSVSKVPAIVGLGYECDSHSLGCSVLAKHRDNSHTPYKIISDSP